MTVVFEPGEGFGSASVPRQETVGGVRAVGKAKVARDCPNVGELSPGTDLSGGLPMGVVEGG